MSEAAISNARHKESAASDMQLATLWLQGKDLRGDLRVMRQNLPVLKLLNRLFLCNYDSE